MSRASRRAARLLRHLRGRSIGVVGLGQVGGSLVQRLERFRPSIGLFGFDLRDRLAPRAQPYCQWCDRLDEIVTMSDVIVLAVPVPRIVRLLPRIARLASKRTSRRRLLVCDVGTVKGQVVAAAAKYRAEFDFVGLHPLAGSERNGWDSADPDLFERRTVIFCPTGRRADALARELIALLGGQATPMSPARHDELAAEGIGIPHVLAFAAAGLSGRNDANQPLRGGSWRSLTRVSASDPTMVAGFLHANARIQRRVLGRLQARLTEIDRLLARPTGSGLERRLRDWQRT